MVAVAELDREVLHHRLAAAEDGDLVAGIDLGVVGRHPPGREDVRDHDRLLVGDVVGQLHEVERRERHARRLGLEAVESARVVRPAVEGGSRPVRVGDVALRRVAGAAVRAAPAPDCRGDDDAIADAQVAHRQRGRRLASSIPAIRRTSRGESRASPSRALRMDAMESGATRARMQAIDRCVSVVRPRGSPQQNLGGGLQ